MAAAGGAERTAVSTDERYGKVEHLLRTEPWTFGFFQAVRLLERMLRDRNPVGRFVHPSKETVRFGVHSVTAFPASQIQELHWDTGGAPVMVVNFFGLTGPSGVLPLYYSELIRERLRQKDPTLLSFLNLFNHRMLSLFYQAWEKYRFTVAYERGQRDGRNGRDRFSHHLLDLIGLGTDGLQNRQTVTDDSLLFYSGLLALHTRSVSALKSILEDYFEVPVVVEQFVGAWYPLAAPDQCCFEDGDSFSEQLGVGVVVGDEIWDQQSGVRIRLGPLTLKQYADFLPEGAAYQPMRAITRFFAGDETDFEVQLVLRRDEVPGCELAEVSADRMMPQLGWSTWVKTAPMGRDPGDTILRI
jgi:type VI secretion system protein ImpH